MISREVAEDLLRDRPPQVRAAILEQIDHETIEHQADELAKRMENAYNRVLGPTINCISETRMRLVAYFSKDLPLLCLIHSIYVIVDAVGACFLLFLPDKDGYLFLWGFWIAFAYLFIMCFFCEPDIYYKLINRAYSNNDAVLLKTSKIIPLALLLVYSIRVIVFIIFHKQYDNSDLKSTIHLHNGASVFNYGVIWLRTIDLQKLMQMKINTANRIRRIDLEMRGEPTNTEG